MRQKGSAVVIFLIIVAVLSTGTAAYLFGRNQNLIKGLDLREKNSIEVAGEAIPSAFPSSSSKANAEVVFEAEGSFTKLEKDELAKKVINPFLDYYKMEEARQILLTLTVSKNDKESKDSYPYQAQAVFQGGGNMGFLIMKEGAGVSWWAPECLNGCTLSPAYKAKYPSVASKVE